MRSLKYETTPRRAIMGVLALAGTVVLAWFLLSALNVSTWDEDQPQSIGEWLRAVSAETMVVGLAHLAVMGVATVIWSALRWRRWLSALTLGFGVTAIAALSYVAWNMSSANASQGHHDDPIDNVVSGLPFSMIVGVVGAIVALVAWRFAYRRSALTG